MREGLSNCLVEETVKFGDRNLMLWNCISWDGGYATKIDGRMDADFYVAILEDELQQSLIYWDKFADNIILQQDNNLKHTSKKA